MDIYVYDKNINRIGIIPDYHSLIWNSIYGGVGKYELRTPLSCEVGQYNNKNLKLNLFKMFKDAYCITSSDFTEFGLVENIGVDKHAKSVHCKGSFGEAILKNDIIFEDDLIYTVTDEDVGTVIIDLISRYYSGDIPIVASPFKTGIKISFQDRGSNLLDKCYEVLNTVGYTFNLRLNPDNKTLELAIWQGLDRTEEQSENSFAIFSSDFENINDATYSDDISDYKNYAVIAGEGEGSERVIFKLDKRPRDVNGNPTELKRTIWVDARDLQKTDEIGYEEYTYLMAERGIEKLAEHPQSIEASIEFNTNGSLTYGEDFFLGDVCTFKDEDIDIKFNDRIRNVLVTYERNLVKIDLSIGETEKTITQKIKREIK